MSQTDVRSLETRAVASFQNFTSIETSSHSSQLEDQHLRATWVTSRPKLCFPFAISQSSGALTESAAIWHRLAPSAGGNGSEGAGGAGEGGAGKAWRCGDEERPIRARLAINVGGNHIVGAGWQPPLAVGARRRRRLLADRRAAPAARGRPQIGTGRCDLSR